MSKKKLIPLEEKKARILIKLRGYKVLRRKEYKNASGFLVKTSEGKALVFCVPSKGTVGVAYINQLAKEMKEQGWERGLVVTGGRYTQAAKKRSVENNIELVPRIFPVFNLFNHELVPKHEILGSDEREELLNKYRVQPYQLPKIKTSDPAVTAIGAKAGDIVKIIRDSPTAGKYTAYRYVVES